ncbi:16948_t:CDS:2, partial [Gigaspora rosea]
MSEISSPTSTFTTAMEDSPTLAHVVKRWKMKELIDFLRKEEDLDLSETAIKILKKEEINGCDFLKITKEELRSYGIPGGPTSRLSDFAKELSKRKLRKNYGSLVVDSLEAMRNEYVIAILHTVLNIARDNTQKKFSMRPYPGEISQGSKLPYTIEFTEDALNEESEEYQILRKSVKRVLGVVVGLLKDR